MENKLYKCELITCEDQVVERFYRWGKNEQDVIDGLEMFQWPDGHWELTEQPEPENDENEQ